MKLICGMDIKNGKHCGLSVNHNGPCVSLMVPQSRRASFIEAVVNTSVGYAISFFATVLLFHLYSIDASAGKIHMLTFWMTLLSIARGYILRRVFNSELWKKVK